MGKHKKWGKRLYAEQASEDEDDTAPQFPWFVPISGDDDTRYPDALLADVVCPHRTHSQEGSKHTQQREARNGGTTAVRERTSGAGGGCKRGVQAVGAQLPVLLPHPLCAHMCLLLCMCRRLRDGEKGRSTHKDATEAPAAQQNSQETIKQRDRRVQAYLDAQNVQVLHRRGLHAQLEVDDGVWIVLTRTTQQHQQQQHEQPLHTPSATPSESDTEPQAQGHCRSFLSTAAVAADDPDSTLLSASSETTPPHSPRSTADMP